VHDTFWCAFVGEVSNQELIQNYPEGFDRVGEFDGGDRLLESYGCDLKKKNNNNNFCFQTFYGQKKLPLY
jgi:hypothetical protein